MPEAGLGDQAKVPVIGAEARARDQAGVDRGRVFRSRLSEEHHQWAVGSFA